MPHIKRAVYTTAVGLKSAHAQPSSASSPRWSPRRVYHVFRRGHRVIVQVQSSWFPLIDRNPQTFVDIPKAPPSAYQKATERVYHGGGRASSITLPVQP
jgi:uncharacterized protein